MFNLRALIQTQRAKPPEVVDSVARKPGVSEKEDVWEPYEDDSPKLADEDDRKPEANPKDKSKKKKAEEDDDDDAEEVLFEQDYDFDVDSEQNDEKEVAFQNYEEKIPALYEASTASHPTPGTSNHEMLRTIEDMLLPTVKFSARSMERFKPMRRMVRHPRLGRVKVMETPEEARKRVLKQERSKEMSTVRMRWKKRRFDYRNEKDVGKAIEARVKRIVETQIREQTQKKEQKRKRRRLLDEGKKEREDELDNEFEEDASLDEQKELLNRLTQNSTEHEVVVLEEEEHDPAIPYKDRMDYWQYGMAAPKKSDLDIDIALRRSDLVCATANRPDIEPEEAGLKVRLEEISNYGRRTSSNSESFWQQYYFPKNELGYQSLDFTQVRNLRSIASRYLCGGIGDYGMENRLICALHAKSRRYRRLPVAHYNKQTLLLALSQQRGENLVLYFKKRWINRQEAARHLILYPDSTSLVGKSLKPASMKDCFSRLRSKARKSLSSGPEVQWMPESPGENESIELDIKNGTSEISASFSSHPTGRKVARNEDKAEEASPSNEDLMKQIAAEGTDVVQSDVQNAMDLDAHPDDSSPAGKVIHCATDDGVVMDMDSTATKFQGLPVDVMKPALVMPITTFAYLPGTAPPIPPFPLGALGIVVGPVDRCFNHYHTAKVDDATYNITVSTLLSRLAVCAGDTESDGVIELQDQLETYAKDYASLHESDIMRWTSRTDDARDVSIVTYYKGVMGVCSIMSNLLPANAKEDEVDDPNHEVDDLYSDAGEGSNPQIKEAAENIFNFCTKRLHDRGLLRFPRAHLTYAISLLCRGLPSSAVEIISRPTSDTNAPTAIDLFKEMLENLEGEGKIVHEKRYSEDDAVVAAELEYIMHKAATTCQKCIDADPLNPDYHMWHIGSLGACLLISSGNLIGREVHRFPSSKEIISAVLELGRQKSDQLRHEARPKLAKFEEVRMELAQSVRVLFTLARHQKGPRIHQAIASLLEWHQVVALLVGAELDAYLREITTIHRHHSLQWSLQTKMCATHEDGFSASDKAALRAFALENEPGEIENWRKLVAELGTDLLGVLGHGTADEKCHRIFCNECKCLRSPLLVDHEAWSKKKSGDSWWGRNREWWVSGLLGMTKTTIPLRCLTRKRAAEVLAKVQERIVELPHRAIGADTGVVNDDSVQGSTSDLAWLPRHGDDDSGIVTLEDRCESYNFKLPQSYFKLSGSSRRSFNAGDEYPSPPVDLPNFSGPNALQLELFCYKVLIFCHLRDLDSTMLSGFIHPMLVTCWNKGSRFESCDEFSALLWLCKIGLDVPRLKVEYVVES